MGKQKIDNFEELAKTLEFPNEGEFYYVFVIKRLKDEPDTKEYDTANKNVFYDGIYYSGWVITSKEELVAKKDEIVSLCEEKNARAYLTINRRNLEETENFAKAYKEAYGVDGYEFMYAATFGELFNFYNNGRQQDEAYFSWLNSHPRVLIDVDTDSKEGQDGVFNFLCENGFRPIASCDTPSGGKQYICENPEVKNLDFQGFDIYDCVGKYPQDLGHHWTVVHCLHDIAINLYYGNNQKK